MGVVGRRWVSSVARGGVGPTWKIWQRLYHHSTVPYVGSEVASRVEVSVISWAGVGVGRDDMMIWFCELDATYNIKE